MGGCAEHAKAMIFIEMFVAKGTLSEDERRAQCERLITEVVYEETAPPEVIASSRAMCQVVVHEPDTWVVGPGGVPRTLVRLTVPGAWRKEASAEFIARAHRVVGDDAWVHVVGVPEGSQGAFGQVMRSTDIIKAIVAPMREAGIEPGEPEPGTLIDPICFMTIPLGEKTITMERDGVTYAFCSAGCRHVFADSAGYSGSNA